MNELPPMTGPGGSLSGYLETAAAAAARPKSPVFLSGESEMARLMRACDWSSTPLGPPRGWPQALRVAIRLALNTRLPMLVFWGAALTCFYNDEARALIGPDRRPEVLGRPGREAWGDIWDIIGPPIQQVMSGGDATWNEDHRWLARPSRDGDAGWTSSFSPIDDETAAGGVGGVLVVCAETPAQVPAALRQTERVEAHVAERGQLAQLFAEAPSFMALLSGPEHRIELANAAFLRLVGHREILGNTVADALPAAVEQGYLGLLDGVFRSGKALASKGAKYAAVPTAEGAAAERFLDFLCQPVRDARGEVSGIFVVGEDVTDRIVAERAIRHLNETLEQRVAAETAARGKVEEALRQAQKMEAVGQLTGGIAHDFNNILQAVGSGIELARRRIAAGRPGDAPEFLGAAREAAARAGALTQRLLAFGRRQALDPKPVVLDGLIQGLAGLVRQTVGPGIKVELELKDGCWPVRCDPNQLESALLNLAINARDAIPSGNGRLLIETTHVELGTTDTDGWGAATPGEYVRIGVCDSGTGMPPEVLAHAFEPFFTTKPSGQGTGLGLSQLYGFVRQSQGVVQLESEVGVGTCVRLFLPRSHDMPSAAEGAAEPAELPQLPVGAAQAVTVLLVEDETAVRSFAAETLRELGYRVVEAADGPAGLTALQNALGIPEAGGIDLLVTDVGLPGGLNGRQLADAARALVPDLQVLLITGYAGDAIEGQGQLGPDMQLLGKPFELEALARRVQDMIGRKRR